jgi:inosine-uridine nucleoside N-ribohydrolase
VPLVTPVIQSSPGRPTQSRAAAFLAMAWLLAWAGGCAAPAAGAPPDGGAGRLLIIDDDNGMAFDRVSREGCYDVPWSPITDPDGGLELVYALRDPEVRVIGLTCMMGTVSADICLEADRRILTLAGRTDVPIYRGASSAKDLGMPTPASKFLIEAVRAHPGRVEIAASGPLTTIATALMLDPELPRLWKALYVMSGEFGLGSNIKKASFLTNGDLNLSEDADAAAYVFAHAGPCLVIPNELMDDVLVTRADLRAMRDSGTPLGRFLHRETRLWLNLTSVAFGQDGFWPHGMTGIAAALHPRHRGRTVESAVRVRFDGKPTSRHPRGATTTEWTDDPSLPRHTTVLEFRDAAGFRREFLNRLR